VDAQRDDAGAQADRQSSISVVAESSMENAAIGSQRQVVGNDRGLQDRKAGAFGEVFEQEPFVVKLVGRVDRAGTLQQVEWRGLRVAGRLNRFVFRRVLVRLEQDFVQLLAHRLRALAAGQFLGQAVICSATAFLFDGVQRQLKNISRCLLKRPCRSPKVMRQVKRSGTVRRPAPGVTRVLDASDEKCTRQVRKPNSSSLANSQARSARWSGSALPRPRLGRRRFSNRSSALTLDLTLPESSSDTGSCRPQTGPSDPKLAGFFKQ
jgi:hypothetical protein